MARAGGRRAAESVYLHRTLEYNLTIGNRGVSEAELDRVCRIARVDEFFDKLPDGYETQLGDKGVRLSGDKNNGSRSLGRSYRMRTF